MDLEKEIFKDGMPKGYYTQDDNGKYFLDTNHCWSEEVCVAAIVSEVRANIENARKGVEDYLEKLKDKEITYEVGRW